MEFTHATIIALLAAYGVAQAISFALLARTLHAQGCVLEKIHQETNETSASVRTTLDAAIAILQKLNTRA